MTDDLLGLALHAARSAGALVRERRTREVTVAATKSSDVDIVTEADRESEALIRSILAEARPDDGFLGEEGHDDAGTSGIRWVVDPIDGTVNFLYGIPQYAVSIAAERDGLVVAGVVLDVAAGTEYTAERRTAPNGGETLVSRRNGEPNSVRGPAPLSQRLIGTGFSYDEGYRAMQAEALARLLPRIRDIRRMGSCALDLCHVAEGRLDGYFEEGVNQWDHAAGALVAEAAGARWELLPGASGRDLVLCAPEHGFDELRAAVERAGFTAESRE